MTLLDYVQSLQDAGETDITAKVAAWKLNNPTPDVEADISEPIVEDLIIEDQVDTSEEIPKFNEDLSFNLDSFKTEETKAIAKKINDSKKAKKDAAAEQDTTATATPEVSENLESGNGESLFSESKEFIDNYNERQKLITEFKEQKAVTDEQQAKFNSVVNKGNTHTANTYDYKWEVSDEGNIDYYQKKEGTENWKKEDNQGAIFSIAGELGHLNQEQQQQLKEYKKQLQQQKEQRKQQNDPFAFAKNEKGEISSSINANIPIDASLEGFSNKSGFGQVLNLTEPKTKREILDESLGNSNKNLSEREKKFNEAEAAYNDALTPEVKERIAKQAALSGNYEVEKAKILKKLKDTSTISPEYTNLEKELSELENRFSTENQAYINTSAGIIEKRLKEQMVDIEQKASEAAMIKEAEEPSRFNLLGKKLQNVGYSTNLSQDMGVGFAATLIGDMLNPMDKDLVRQQDLYATEKAKYAKENKVNVKNVTDEMVRPAVEAAYVDIFSLQARKDAYEDYSDSLLTDPDVPIFSLFKKVTGFKSIADIFGDTEEEVYADLAAKGFAYDTAKSYLVIEQGQNDVLKIDSQRLALQETTYLTEESSAEAREKYKELSTQRQHNVDIVNDALTTLGEKVTTSKNAGLYSNMLAKNYSPIAGTLGSVVSVGSSLISDGIEAAERYGLTKILNPLSRLPMDATMREALFGKDGLFDSRKITDVQQSLLDAVSTAIDEEMAEGKDWDNSDSLMEKGRWFGRTIGQQIPIYATLYGTGGAGLGLIGLSTAGSKFKEMQNEIDFNGAEYTPFQMYTAATTTGASAVASEYITQGMLGRLGVNFRADKLFANGFKETMGNIVKGGARWVVDQSEEVGSEVADNIVGNIVDKYVLKKEGVNIFDNVKETALSTLWTSGIAMRLPTIGAAITAPFRSKESFQIIGENTRTIKKLSAELENSVLDDSGRKSIENQIQGLVVENMEALKTDLSRLDDMTDAEKKALMDSKASEYENLREIEKINNNRTMPRDIKSALIKDLQVQIRADVDKRYQIMGPYILAENKAKNLPALEKSIENVQKVTQEILGEDITVVENMDDLPEGIPKFVDAYVDPKTQKIYINKEWAATVGAVTAVEHELLHKIQRSLFKSNPKKALEIVDDFKNTLGSNELDLVQERIDANYRYKLTDDGKFELDDQGNKIENKIEDYAEEYFNVFSDLVGNNKIGFTDNLGENLLRLFNKVKDKIWPPEAGFTNLEFKSGRDAYNFIKDYNKDIRQGKLSDRATGLLKEGSVVSNRDKGNAVDGRETQNSITQTKITDVDNLADRYKVDPTNLSNKETQNLKTQYTKLGIDALKQWSGKRNVPINNLLSNPNTFKSIESDILNQFPSIMKNYTPINKTTGKPQKLSTYIGNILGRRVGPKLVEDYAKRLDTQSISSENQKELESIQDTSKGPVTEVDTDVKLVDNIKINKKPLSVEFKDKVRGFVTDQLEGLDPKSEEFRKQVFKPSKAFVDLISKDIIGSPKKFREFLNENPTFYKGLNITELIAIDDGRVKKGQPRLFTEVNRRLTKQAEIEKFMMQGRVPYLTTTQQKAGANLYNRLTPKVAAVVNNFFGSTPSNNSNRKRAIAKAIANKFIAEAAPSTDAFKAQPQNVRAKTAEKLQVSQNAQFSITSKGMQDVDLNLTDAEKRGFVKNVNKSIEKGIPLDQAITLVANAIGKNRGFAYENVIIDKLSRLKIKGFKVSDQAGGNKVGIPDFAAKIFDANFDVEVKMEKAQYSDIGLVSRNQDIDFNSRVKKKNYSFAERIQKELINPAKIAMKAYRKRAGELGADLNLYDKTGKLPSTIYVKLKAENFQKAVTQKAKFNQDIISEIYQNKVPPTSYIQLKNSGLFFMGTNPLGLPLSEFKADVNVSLRIFYGGKSMVDGVEMTTVNLRTLPDNLTNVSKSNYSLDSASSMTALMNTPAAKMLDSNSIANKKLNNPALPASLQYSITQGGDTIIQAMLEADKALANARKLGAPVKKIRVFDFDDTLARTNSQVIVTSIDGKTKKINATEFALQSEQLEAEGATFDYSEFSKVIDGKKGPLFELAKKISESPGSRDMFILTARPQNAANGIKTFLDGIGLNIPLGNITGLQDGAPQAKARWMVDKAAEGYNDFYFADDALKNVKAVKDVLSQIDVKSKVQLAKFSKTKTFDTIVNDMIEDSSGIESYKQYSAARAQTIGANKGKFNFFIPASAEDFTGLLYKMIGKGKKGDAQMAFLKSNLLDTYDRAESAVTQAKIAAANDFKALKNKLTTLPNSLSKPTGIGGFTFSHAVRTAIWSAQGMEIPGLSKRDIQELNDFVENNAELKVFANELIKIQKGKPYPKPGKSWLGGNITSDIINDINKANRAEYQQEWRENVDIIFSEANMNKMEAAFGTRWREAMQDSLRRMKSGSNRPVGGNKTTDALLDWLNNSVGAVMFLNTRSAVLQTISAVNFLNWGDNNVVKAAAAFANQKQYWSDFNTLMNSDYLVERRNGLKINVSESEIQDAVRDSTNKSKAIIALILSKGFVFTRFADSFAIATGGSTFYRNRVSALVAKGMDQKAAEAQAFEDFRQIAEESQQSSNPNRISEQQASGAGRVILAWANTPMQYARIQKRAAQDLINGRGDWKTNVSKIAYYGVVQNLIFNALQQALFAIAFDDDDDEKEADSIKAEERYIKVANGMVDSQLKGLGILGSATVAVKNTLMTLYEEHGKKNPKYENAVDDLLSFSPPLGSKISKIKGGFRSFSWNRKEMKEKGFSLDNPAYLAGAQIVTGFTNIPLDRLMKKINNVRGMLSTQSELWQKVALGLGWSTWNLGLGYYGGFDAAKVLTPEEELTKEVTDMKKLTKTKEQVDMLLDLGLTKKEIKALGKEEARVRKIIELQKKDKK